MTDYTDLIARLRDTASRGVSVWGDLQMGSADALEAAQAEIERLTADRRVLQADGKHPAPCAKFCEATAFTIELRRAQAEIERLREVWLEDGVRASEDRGDLLKERDQAQAEIEAQQHRIQALWMERDVVRVERDKALARLAEVEGYKDGAYTERNQLVSLLSKLFPSGTQRTAIEGWSDDWHGCVYIDLPTGQASWHYHDSQAHLFAHLPPYAGTWDGHTTEQKYERIAGYAAAGASPVQPIQGLQSVADALTIEQLNDKVGRLMAVRPSQAPTCDLRGIDAGPLSEWVDLVRRGYVAKDECLIAVKDVPKWLAQNQPSQAVEVSKQDIYDIAHRKATRYVCTAAPSDVMYGFSEMHLLDFVAAINAKESGK